MHECSLMRKMNHPFLGLRTVRSTTEKQILVALNTGQCYYTAANQLSFIYANHQRSLDIFRAKVCFTWSPVVVYMHIHWLRDTQWMEPRLLNRSLTEKMFYWAVFHTSWERERLHETLQGKMFICRSACVREKIHGAEWWCTVLVFTHSNRLLPPASKHTRTYTHAKQSPTPIHSLTDGQDDGVM